MTSIQPDPKGSEATANGSRPDPPLNAEQEALVRLWEEHIATEFAEKSADSALATMVERPLVNHVPVMTGGSGRAQLHRFYSRYFIPQMPPDTALVPVSRTVGSNRIVDEFIFQLTHTVQMDWFLPGVPPTNRPVSVAMIVVVEFEDGKIACERIHWDQATVLVQVGLLDPGSLPVAGVETALKVLDPSRPSNELIKRSRADADL